MEQYYKLGGNASIFWDPTQPLAKNQKLMLNEIKALKATDKVVACAQRGGLIKLSKSEAEAELARIDENFKQNIKAENAAQKKLDQLSVKEQKVVEKERELKVREKALSGLEDENEELKKQNADLLTRIEELEKENEGLTGTGDKK